MLQKTNQQRIRKSVMQAKRASYANWLTRSSTEISGRLKIVTQFALMFAFMRQAQLLLMQTL
jgi:hypothetical protein